MIYQPAVAGSARMPLLHEPAVIELTSLHAFLFGRGYMSAERNRKETAAKSLAYTLGRDVHGGLKPAYLRRAFKIEEGLSWSKMFGNFMATAAGFRAVLHTAGQDERGFVALHDSLAIRAMFVALHEFRKAVREIEGRDVSAAMEHSAAFCGGLVDKLQGLFHESDHWATVTRDGQRIVEKAIDRQALADPKVKSLSLVEKASGAVTLLTAGGLEAFKAWADEATDINRFMDSVQVPPEAEVGTDKLAVGVEKYVRRGGLPAPHPSYASPAYRVMVELMAIAEQNSMPELQFGYNGWRRAYRAMVPADHADEFLRAVRNNEEMGSLRGEHDWWVERIGEQIKIVIPTQPTIDIQNFISFSKSLMERVTALYYHFQDVRRQEEIDLDARDKDGVSIRVKLNEFEEAFQELAGMQAFLVAERERAPDSRTQESFAVSALIDRLTFLVEPYRNVYLQRDDRVNLADNIGEALSRDVFNLLEHMPDRHDGVPRVDVYLAEPRYPFTPRSWVKSYPLMVALYKRIAEKAGASDEDNRYPVNVEVGLRFDSVSSSIQLINPDRRFIEDFVDLKPDGESHLVPGAVREILADAEDVAPEGRSPTVDLRMNLMNIPIQVRREEDTRGVPQAPNMARFSRPDPSMRQQSI